MNYRDRHDLIADVLELLQVRPDGRTNIRSRLGTHKPAFDEVFSISFRTGLIECKFEERITTGYRVDVYHITDKGIEYLRRWKSVEEMLQ